MPDRCQDNHWGLKEGWGKLMVGVAWKGFKGEALKAGRVQIRERDGVFQTGKMWTAEQRLNGSRGNGDRWEQVEDEMKEVTKNQLSARSYWENSYLISLNTTYSRHRYSDLHARKQIHRGGAIVQSQRATELHSRGENLRQWSLPCITTVELWRVLNPGQKVWTVSRESVLSNIFDRDVTVRNKVDIISQYSHALTKLKQKFHKIILSHTMCCTLWYVPVYSILFFLMWIVTH